MWAVTSLCVVSVTVSHKSSIIPDNANISSMNLPDRFTFISDHCASISSMNLLDRFAFNSGNHATINSKNTIR